MEGKGAPRLTALHCTDMQCLQLFSEGWDGMASGLYGFENGKRVKGREGKGKFREEKGKEGKGPKGPLDINRCDNEMRR
jgi:hypothetical protein